MPRGHLKEIANTIHCQMQKYAVALQDALIHSERKVIAAFVQSSQDYFDAEPSFKQLYIPQSGEIFGIIKQDIEGDKQQFKEAKDIDSESSDSEATPVPPEGCRGLLDLEP